MAIWELFSQRERKRQGQDGGDILQYDNLPSVFRLQVVYIWAEALSESRFGTISLGPGRFDYPPDEWWHTIHKAVAREKGLSRLANESDPFRACRNYLLTADPEDAIDLIDVSFQVIDRLVRKTHPYRREQLRLVEPTAAIVELNARFRQHAIGYQFEGGRLVRVDSQYLHAEAVRPAVQLLHGAGNGFAGPLEEFLTAHQHHRKGNQKDAITNALKAFESTLKAVCAARKWSVDPNAAAKALLQGVFDNQLIPAYLQAEFSALRSVLEAGVPTVRNKTSGHGQGPTPTTVPDHLASFVLHQTAAAIVFLIESHKAMR